MTEMEGDYYQRTGTPSGDGQILWQNEVDQENERIVARCLETAWNCQIKPFGLLCPIDFYALRNNAMVALIELKSKPFESTRYNHAWLNIRKWLALVLGQNGLGVPSFFVVKFSDDIFYIRVDEIDGTKIKIGGTKRIVKSHTDIEPVIIVPINQMKRLNERKPNHGSRNILDKTLP